VKRSVLLAMIAYSFASLGSWALTARTLGAVFAGSAVALSATALHGGPLLTGGNKPVSITERPANSTAPPQQLPAESLPAPMTAPWAPDVASQLPPPFSPPLPPPPLLFAPPYMPPMAPPPSMGSFAPQGSPEEPASGPMAPRGPGEAAGPRHAPPPSPADQPGGKPVGGVLGSVFGATKGIPAEPPR
jgi:hypothetical protein